MQNITCLRLVTRYFLIGVAILIPSAGIFIALWGLSDYLIDKGILPDIGAISWAVLEFITIITSIIGTMAAWSWVVVEFMPVIMDTIRNITDWRDNFNIVQLIPNATDSADEL